MKYFQLIRQEKEGNTLKNISTTKFLIVIIHNHFTERKNYVLQNS